MTDCNENYTLRLQPTTPLRPVLDVILATSTSNSPIIETTCAQFAQDFNIIHISLPSYLPTMLDPQTSQQWKMLGGMHPHSLRSILEQKDGEVPTYFSIEILKRKLDVEVERGSRMFLISGIRTCQIEVLDRSLARPVAIFDFKVSNEIRSPKQQHLQRHLEDVKCVVDIDGEVETYRRLLGCIYGKAMGRLTEPKSLPEESCDSPMVLD